MDTCNSLTENEQRLRSLRKVNTHNKLGENIRKIVVTYPNHESAFITIDQSKPLKDSIQKVFERMKITSENIEDFSLAFDEPTIETKFEETSEKCFYITEERKTVNQIINSMRSNVDISTNFDLLLQRTIDLNFVTCFIDQSGMKLVTELISNNKCQSMDLEKLLGSFSKLMEYSLISWNEITENFISGLSKSILTCRGVEGVLQNSLEIFDNVVNHSSKANMKLIEKLISADILARHIESGSGDIQKAVITLINSLFAKSSLEQRKTYADTLTGLRIRNIIYKHIINDRSDIGTELKLQLYKLQCYLFSYLEIQLKAPPSEQEVSTLIEQMRMTVFNREIEVNHNKARRESFCNYNQRLGFRDCDNPVNDFLSVPHGYLALNSMIYFSKYHRNSFIRVNIVKRTLAVCLHTYRVNCNTDALLILEKSTQQNDSVPLQFVRSSVSLTKLLCDLLYIGIPPSDECKMFQPTFYKTENPYEELFSLAIQTMSKTWHEMKAVNADFDKMVDVVKEQLSRCLRQFPETKDTFDKMLHRFTYNQIIEMWRNDIDNREQTRIYDAPVVELRRSLEPEVIGLIRKHRLHHMTKGTLFNKYKKDGNRIKDRYMFCRLSDNMKSLHYGDCIEKSRPTIDELPNKLNILDMQYLVTGKECLNYIGVKEKSKIKSGTNALQFAIIYEASTISNLSMIDTLLKNDEAILMFTANSIEEYSLWTDGLHALLDQNMVSDMLLVDTESLLNMEQKIKLYYTTNLSIPNQTPTIPSPPDDLNNLIAELAR